MGSLRECAAVTINDAVDAKAGRFFSRVLPIEELIFTGDGGVAKEDGEHVRKDSEKSCDESS